MGISFEALVQAAQQLTIEQKILLVESLHLPDVDLTPTREQLIAELETLQASGAFEGVESLRNKFANPALENLTEEQLLADIRAAATEWEQELDEFFNSEH